MSLLNRMISSKFEERDALRIVRGIVSGMRYLHERTPSIIHYDLKPANILLDTNLAPKICDFGLSKTISKISEHSITKEIRGTCKYASPECTDPKRRHLRSAKSDVYSFAIVFFEIYFNHAVWPDLSYLEVFQEQALQKRPILRTDCNPIVADIIQRCWLEGSILFANFLSLLSFEMPQSKKNYLKIQKIDQNLKIFMNY